ncbi:MAG: aldo/keto reductase, partial [Spirochaetaceae bacterium]|nr:aldo/keto reductase [Spirochaetaceae bacterium]
MEYVALGRANLLVSRIAFGAYGLQYVDSDEAAASLVNMAYQGGINFFDTARHKPTSELRLGKAVQTIQRQHIILASKSMATDGKALREDIENS